MLVSEEMTGGTLLPIFSPALFDIMLGFTNYCLIVTVFRANLSCFLFITTYVGFLNLIKPWVYFLDF